MTSFRHAFGKWTARVFIVVITWAVLFILADRLLLPLYTRRFQERSVPLLVGAPLYEATFAAERNGFRLVKERTRPDAKVLPQTVVEQRPPGGTHAKPGCAIYVTVAARVAEVTVPNLFGLSPREAELKLEATGLVAATALPEFEYSDLSPAGFITRQQPAAGLRVKPATTITFVLSKGPSPGNTMVPNLIGLNIAEAAQTARASRLLLSEPLYERSLTVAEGQVVRQSPIDGAIAPDGSEIQIIVSSGK